jgi:hypothetical protein
MAQVYPSWTTRFATQDMVRCLASHRIWPEPDEVTKAMLVEPSSSSCHSLQAIRLVMMHETPRSAGGEARYAASEVAATPFSVAKWKMRNAEQLLNAPHKQRRSEGRSGCTLSRFQEDLYPIVYADLEAQKASEQVLVLIICPLAALLLPSHETIYSRCQLCHHFLTPDFVSPRLVCEVNPGRMITPISDTRPRGSLSGSF